MATTLTARELLALVDRPMTTSAVAGATVRAGRPTSKTVAARLLKELVASGALTRTSLRTRRHRNGVDVWAPPGASTEAIQRAAEVGAEMTPSGLAFNEHGAPMRMGGA